MKPQSDHTPVTPNLIHHRYDNLFKEIITAGWNVSSDGNVESSWGFFAITEIPSHPGEFADMVTAVAPDTEVGEFRQMVRELPAGWYFTIENSDGLIWVYQCESELQAKHIFESRLKDFSDSWHDGFGGEPLENGGE